MPTLHEPNRIEVCHRPAFIGIKAACRQIATGGNVSFGESRPARQRISECADAPLVASNRAISKLLLPLCGEASHRVEGEPVVLVNEGQNVVDERLHLFLLVPVVLNAGCRQDATMTGFSVDAITNGLRVLHVVEGAVPQGGACTGHPSKLLWIGVVQAPFERVESRFDARLNVLRLRKRTVRGEKDVGEPNLLFGVPDGAHEEIGIHEGFPQEENAKLLNASIAHLADDACVEVPGHVLRWLRFARAKSAKTAPVIASPRQLDLDALGGRWGRGPICFRDLGYGIDPIGDPFHVHFLSFRCEKNF